MTAPNDNLRSGVSQMNINKRHQEYKSRCLHNYVMSATDLGSLGGFFMSKGVGMDNENILDNKRAWSKYEKNKKRALASVEYALVESKEENNGWGLVISLVVGALVWGLIMYVIFFSSCTPAHAETVDLKKIAQIESSGCKELYGKYEEARGCYQITPVVLEEFNRFMHKEPDAMWIPYLTMEDMLIHDKCYMVANWYINTRIPQMLRAYKKPVTVRNQIIAYNAGISYVVKNKPLPKVTLNYLRKYGA